MRNVAKLATELQMDMATVTGRTNKINLEDSKASQKIERVEKQYLRPIQDTIEKLGNQKLSDEQKKKLGELIEKKKALQDIIEVCKEIVLVQAMIFVSTKDILRLTADTYLVSEKNECMVMMQEQRDAVVEIKRKIESMYKYLIGEK